MIFPLLAKAPDDVVPGIALQADILIMKLVKVR
jgi:hypothetical protein